MTGTAYGRPAQRAAAPTCHGHRATIVGRLGQRFTGTGRRDVIVTNGGYGDAKGGNDLICVTHSMEAAQQIAAGPGNDVVDASRLRHLHPMDSMSALNVDLGAGDDVFTGSRLSDGVIDDSPGSQGHDVIRTGAGADRVATGSGGGRDDDTVDTGFGRDAVKVFGKAQGLQVDGGSGFDVIQPYVGHYVGRLGIDDRRHVLRHDGSVVGRLTSLEYFQLPCPTTRGVTFEGSFKAETLSLGDFGVATPPTWRVTAHMGGGNDVLVNSSRLAPLRGTVVGGPGRDELDGWSRSRTGLGIDLGGAVTVAGATCWASAPSRY